MILSAPFYSFVVVVDAIDVVLASFFLLCLLALLHQWILVVVLALVYFLVRRKGRGLRLACEEMW